MEQTLSKQIFYLNNLNCANCAAKIQTALENTYGAQNLSFSFATKKLQLYSNDHTPDLQRTIQQIVDHIEEGVSVDTQPTSHSTGGSCSISNSSAPQSTSFQGSIHVPPLIDSSIQQPTRLAQVTAFFKAKAKEIVGLLLLLITIFFLSDQTYRIIGFGIAYLLIGGNILLKSGKNIMKGRLFDEYFLMSVATIGAFILGEYTESVFVMLFYKVGEGFQAYAADKSRRNIQELLNIKAEYGNLLVDHQVRKVAPESLQIDDLILVKAGEKVPVDGIVVKGHADIDHSALTGESLPRRVVPAAEILSGSIVLDAALTIRVNQTYENSTVAKILDMVENAAAKKAKTERFITKFARFYTPLVVFASLLLAFLPPILIDGDYPLWISRALIFLVISCPCALVLSVPLGFFGGLGAAGRQGILIKGGNYLEALNHIDIYLFDKTGTLTEGNFAVQHFTDDRTLELAALLEQYSNHPIAQSIVRKYPHPLNSTAVSQVKEISGQGLSGYYHDKLLVVGNATLMNTHQIPISVDFELDSVVYVGYDHQFVGRIEIADQIKPQLQNLAHRLHQIGAKLVVMLTGDQKKVADKVAATLCFDKVHSQLLPQDKMNYLEDYLQAGYKTLFVGDGINDAPVLARADIGVAMGGLGSDAAIEAADIILMNDDPTKLLVAHRIAVKTRRIVIQNIVFALTIKLSFLVLGAFGLATMYEAVFADVGVALLCVLNAMRILQAK